MDVAQHPDAAVTPCVVIHRFEAPLVFANAEVFTDDVLAVLASASPPTSTLILDFAAVPDIDSTGDAALAELSANAARPWHQAAARPGERIGPGLMKADGVVDALGEGNIFPP